LPLGEKGKKRQAAETGKRHASTTAEIRESILQNQLGEENSTHYEMYEG
jgi:hypothetical protein